MDRDTEYQQAHDGAVLFDVSSRAKVQLSGKDSRSFLHNLCTNDINRLAPGAGCEAFLATAQAKLIAYVLIYHTPAGDYWLDADPGTSATMVKHLDHHLISEQVEIVDRSHDFGQFHLAGPRAEAILSQLMAGPIDRMDELQHCQVTFQVTPCYLRRHGPLGVTGFDLVCPRQQCEPLRGALQLAGVMAGSAETYELLRIENGTPAFGVDLDETCSVMDVGRAQAVSYTKGCYLGQEPIVMARDRGHANRALMRLRFSEGTPSPGSRLLREGKEMGRITSAAVSVRLGPIGLGFVRRGSQEPGTILQMEGGGAAEVLAP